jgi:hypothetical protein
MTIGHRGRVWLRFPLVRFLLLFVGFRLCGDELTLVAGFDRFLVASQFMRDLLLCAKYLFVTAIAWQRCDLRRRRGSKKLSAEVTNSPKKKAPAVGAGGRARPGPKFTERIDHRGRDGGGENHFLSPTSPRRYRLVALPPSEDLFDDARDLFDKAKPMGHAKLF